MNNPKTPSAMTGPTKTQGVGAVGSMGQKAPKGRPAGKPINYPNMVGMTK